MTQDDEDYQALLKDAKRYRIVRDHIPPRALAVALGVAWTDIPKDMEINAKCDELCDAALRGKGGA